MSKRKRPSQRVRVSGQHPPFPRRPELWIALGLTALAPSPALAAFPANINLSALNGTNGFKLSGVAAGDFSGRAVSTAGDVNGDGVDDLLIGAPRADPNGNYSGASYVVFGRAGVGNGGNLQLSALDGTNGFRLSGVAANDNSGLAVSMAGDVNGDGMDDLLIGAPGAGTFSSGASYVVFGGAGVGSGGHLDLSALDGTNGFRLSGVAVLDYSGVAVSTAGDVNGDGIDDLLIGAPGESRGPAGASYVVFGGAGVGNGGNINLSALDGTNGFKLSGVDVGNAVSTAGDVNGDGVDDLLELVCVETDGIVPPGHPGDKTLQGPCCKSVVPESARWAVWGVLVVLLVVGLAILVKQGRARSKHLVIWLFLGIMSLVRPEVAMAQQCCLCSNGTGVPQTSPVAGPGVPAGFGTCLADCAAPPFFTGVIYDLQAPGGCNAPCASKLATPPVAPAGTNCGVAGEGYVQSVGRRCDNEPCFDNVFECTSKGCVGGTTPGAACVCDTTTPGITDTGDAQCGTGTCTGIQGVCVNPTRAPNPPGIVNSLNPCGATADCPAGEVCIPQQTCRQVFVHECTFRSTCVPFIGETPGPANAGACPAGTTKNIVCP